MLYATLIMVLTVWLRFPAAQSSVELSASSLAQVSSSILIESVLSHPPIRHRLCCLFFRYILAIQKCTKISIGLGMIQKRTCDTKSHRRRAEGCLKQQVCCSAEWPIFQSENVEIARFS